MVEDEDVIRAVMPRAPMTPAQPLWRIVPTRGDDGRCLADFMMLVPGLAGGGGEFGYRLSLHANEQRVEIDIDTAPPGSPDYVYPCCFGGRILEAVCDAGPTVIMGREVRLPAGTRQASVHFA